MSWYDKVLLEPGIELPYFPPEFDPSEFEWQTRDFRAPRHDTFKITSDGRLLREIVEMREKTPAEKQSEAEKHGYDSWEEYATAVSEMDMKESVLEEVPLCPSEEVEDEVYWKDQNHHGTFEFYTSSPDASEYEIEWSYEARFTWGDLDDLVFVSGGPQTDTADLVEELGL